jgi:hypothetical protein
VCAAGSYKSSVCTTTKNTVCIPCIQGQYCPIGSTAPILCPAGSYGVAAGAATVASCSACPAGSYTSTQGASACGNCPSGNYTATNNSTACSACSPITVCAQGQYIQGCTASTDTVCTQCVDANLPAFSYWLANQNSCVWACNRVPLYFKSGSVCQVCNTPSSCAIGKYITTCNTTANGVCTPCNNKPLNAYYTSNSPNYDSSACAWSCNNGSSQGASCDLCAEGKYAVNSPPSCLTCIPGSSSLIGSSVCTTCDKGFYTPIIGGVCAPCPVCAVAGNYRMGCNGTMPGICDKCTNTI